MNDTFFSQMAGISATLLGLSFLALTFFIGGLDRRYKELALPIFLHESQRRARGAEPRDGSSDLRPSSPSLATDFQLFDGDPIVVFLAFSTGVSWNLYFLALIVSLTEIDAQLDLSWIITAELVAFWAIISYCLFKRHERYRILDTYRTGEERLWAPGEIVTALVLTGIMLMSLYSAFSGACVRSGAPVCQLAAHGVAEAQLGAAFVIALKWVTVGAICLALYVTNKDLFVFFKARTSDEIRKRWLEQFMADYETLERRAQAAVARVGADSEMGQRLRVVWNNGRPGPVYIRPRFEPSPSRAAQAVDPYWLALQRRSPQVATWMFDVPGIARWADDVEALTLQTESGVAGVASDGAAQ